MAFARAPAHSQWHRNKPEMGYILQNRIHGEMKLRLEFLSIKINIATEYCNGIKILLHWILIKSLTSTINAVWLTQTIRNLCQNFPNRLNFVSKNKRRSIDQQSKNSFFSSGHFLFERLIIFIFIFLLSSHFTRTSDKCGSYIVSTVSSKFKVELNWIEVRAVIGGSPTIFNEF